MVDISSFLTEGVEIPAGSALKATQSQTVLPEWYTNYGMQLLSNQQALMNKPYEAYKGPRVAEFAPAQQQGFAMTGQAAGAYQPGLTAATQATQNLMGQNALGAAQPYFGQAAGMSGVTAATPGLQQGAQLTGQSTQALGMQAAQPFLGQAGQSSVANIGQYMNPYTEQVVNRIGQLAQRNLTEDIMPGIEGRYIAAGQLGFGGRGGAAGTPSGMMTDTARAIRDTQEATLAQQTQALQQGYGQAAELAGTDLARQAQLASTAGQLGTQQQGALAQAGQQMANIGQAYGTLTGQQQRMLADIGSQIGSLGGADITRQLGAAEQLGGLAGTAQTLGLRGAEAVTGVGAQQQAQAQKNLDVAYGDFLRQQGYGQEQINNALATFKGIATGVPTGQQDYGIVPLGYQQEKSPGTAATIAGGLATLAGILGDAKEGSVLGKLLT